MNEGSFDWHRKCNGFVSDMSDDWMPDTIHVILSSFSDFYEIEQTLDQWLCQRVQLAGLEIDQGHEIS